MDNILHEKLLYRIIQGRLRLKLDDLVLFIYEPTNDIVEESIDAYEEAYNKAYFSGVPIKSEILETLIENDMWSPLDDKEAEKISKQIDDLKVEAFSSFYDSNNLRAIKRVLRNLEKTEIKLRAKKHLLDHTTCEGVGQFSRSVWLISKLTFFTNGEPYDWSRYTISAIMDHYNSSTISQEQYRKIARNDPWRSIWNAAKKQGSLFNKPACDFTKDQLSLASYSTLYDNVYESHKCPNDKIIDDDDCLDGWLIQQRRESEKDRKQQEVDSMIKNPKIANSQEIFVMAKDGKAAQDIYDLNDAVGRSTIQSRQNQINAAEDGQVKFTDLSDVRQDIVLQSHQKAISTAKSRAK
jgi:hypothetical protein